MGKPGCLIDLKGSVEIILYMPLLLKFATCGRLFMDSYANVEGDTMARTPANKTHIGSSRDFPKHFPLGECGDMISYRTHSCGELRSSNLKEVVRIAGWMHKKRHMGGVLFIDMRDQSGVVQVVVQHETDVNELNDIPLESVLSIEGRVKHRGPKNVNRKIPTGKIEIEHHFHWVLDVYRGPKPSTIREYRPPSRSTSMDEELVLFRRGHRHTGLSPWSRVLSRVRTFLGSAGFAEMDPRVNESTDYSRYVPSRPKLSKRVLLPKTLCPQYQQLMAVGGIEKWFQMRLVSPDKRIEKFWPWQHAKTFCDIGMSFVTREEVLDITERLVDTIFKTFCRDKNSKPHFPRLSLSQAMRRFGTGHPDLRCPLELKQLLIEADNVRRLFASNWPLFGVRIPSFLGKCSVLFLELSNRIVAKGGPLVFLLKVTKGARLEGDLCDKLTPTQERAVIDAFGATPGDVVALFYSSNPDRLAEYASLLRAVLAPYVDTRKDIMPALCWIVHTDIRKSAVALARGQCRERKRMADLALDCFRAELVCNGSRVGFGSVQIHSLIQSVNLFKNANYEQGIIRRNSNVLLSQLNLGTPPYGGISLDLSALVMAIAEEDSQIHHTHTTAYVPNSEEENSSKHITSTSESCKDDLTWPEFLAGKAIPTDAIIARMEAVAKEEKSEINHLLGLDDCATSGGDYLSAEEKLKLISHVLADFGMTLDQVETLLGLFPYEKDAVLQKPAADVFQFLWGILGNKHVAKILPERDVLRWLVGLGIITHHKQLTFLHPSSIAILKRILVAYVMDSDLSADASCQLPACDVVKPWGLEATRERMPPKLVRGLKALLAGRPNDFSTMLDAFWRKWVQEDTLNLSKAERSILLKAAEVGLVSPTFFRLYEKVKGDPNKTVQLVEAIGALHPLVFQNGLIEANVIRETFLKSLQVLEFPVPDDELDPLAFLAEVVYFLFRPANMDYGTICACLGELSDCTQHFTDAGIRFRGEHWDEDSRCFRFKMKDGTKRHTLCVYPSKNVASFFAKSSAGICTAEDLELFHRKDHLHLNLVDEQSVRVVGNAQIYLVSRSNIKSLVVRGINPSTTFVTADNVQTILRAVLKTAIEMSAASDIDEVCVSEPLGVWHSASSRPEMIAVLGQFLHSVSPIVLRKPLLIFRFRDTPKHVKSIYVIWQHKTACDKLTGESI